MPTMMAARTYISGTMTELGQTIVKMCSSRYERLVTMELKYALDVGIIGLIPMK
jgi:hypothetical protein